jgi:hypothetical protein
VCDPSPYCLVCHCGLRFEIDSTYHNVTHEAALYNNQSEYSHLLRCSNSQILKVNFVSNSYVKPCPYTGTLHSLKYPRPCLNISKFVMSLQKSTKMSGSRLTLLEILIVAVTILPSTITSVSLSPQARPPPIDYPERASSTEYHHDRTHSATLRATPIPTPKPQWHPRRQLVGVRTCNVGVCGSDRACSIFDLSPIVMGTCCTTWATISNSLVVRRF